MTEVGASIQVLRELIAKLTGGSGHQDSLIALDRLHINEVLLLKQRIMGIQRLNNLETTEEIVKSGSYLHNANK